MKREAHEAVILSLDPKDGVDEAQNRQGVDVIGPHGKTTHIHYGLDECLHEFPTMYRVVLANESVERTNKSRVIERLRSLSGAAASALF